MTKTQWKRNCRVAKFYVAILWQGLATKVWPKPTPKYHEPTTPRQEQLL